MNLYVKILLVLSQYVFPLGIDDFAFTALLTVKQIFALHVS